MGRLTVTAITTSNPSTHQETSSTANKSAQTTVYAEIAVVRKSFWGGVNQQTYRYAISGVPSSCLNDIPCLVAYLEKILESQRYETGQATDHDYDIPRYLNLARRRQTIVGSARALCNVLEEVISNKGSAIETLIVNNKTQIYIEDRGTYGLGALERLPKVFPKIQPMYFRALTFLQVVIEVSGRNIMAGFQHLLARGCLPNLKTLDLRLSTFFHPSIHQNGWLRTNDAQQVRTTFFYRDGLVPAAKKLPLEHLHLPFWCADGTAHALQALEDLYPRLKTLTVDTMISTAVRGEIKVSWTHDYSYTSYSNGPYGPTAMTSAGTDYHYDVERRIPPEKEVAKQPSLLKLLESMQHVSQLECLEVYDLPVGKSLVVDHHLLQTAIANGWLPKLNTIALRLNIVDSNNYRLDPQFDPQNRMDTSDLLTTIIKHQVPIKKLLLTFPEKDSYQAWLDQMLEGSFPMLEQFHYRIPGRWYRDESVENHQIRVSHALQTLLSAIQKGKLPQFTAFVAEGSQATGPSRYEPPPPLPQAFIDLIEQIDQAIAKQQETSVQL